MAACPEINMTNRVEFLLNSVRWRQLMNVGLAISIGTATLTSCSDAPSAAVVGVSPASLARIQIKEHSITMALGDTLSLHVTAYDYLGKAFTNVDDMEFTSSDSKLVTVTKDGVIKAVAMPDFDLVTVVAKVQRDNVTRSDTASIYITATAPASPPAHLKIIRAEDDSGFVSIAGAVYFDPIVITVSGDTITGPPVWYYALDPDLFMIGQYGWFQGRKFGSARMFGRATVYGVTLIDSTSVFQVTYASQYSFGWNYSSQNGWATPRTVQLRPGGVVSWGNYSANAAGITFDNPDAASVAPVGTNGGGESGNIAPFSGGVRARQFNTPGTYTWRSLSDVGTIVVMPTKFPTAAP